jgi:hypothetical protein
MNDQRSLTDQVESMVQLATEAGLYDAVDWVRNHYTTFGCCVEWPDYRQPFEVDL